MAKTDKELTVELVETLVCFAVKRAKDDHAYIRLDKEIICAMLRDVFDVIHSLSDDSENEKTWP